MYDSGVRFYQNGYRGEADLLSYLQTFYPNIEFTLGNGKSVYDVFCDYALFDNVGVDQQDRLIVDHKFGMYRHRAVSRVTGKPGYIAFKYCGDYCFIPVTAKIFRKKVRPKIDGYLLRSCKKLNLDACEA
jgi:hypothetical protein